MEEALKGLKFEGERVGEEQRNKSPHEVMMANLRHYRAAINGCTPVDGIILEKFSV